MLHLNSPHANAFYSSHSSIASFERNLLARSFNQNFKLRLTAIINECMAVLEDKNCWECIARCDRDTIDVFNHSFSDLVAEIQRIGSILHRQYSYNTAHRRYVFTILFEYVGICRQFMVDVLRPMDFFMQRVASESADNESYRLRNTNKMICLVKYRIGRLAELQSPKYWRLRWTTRCSGDS